MPVHDKPERENQPGKHARRPARDRDGGSHADGLAAHPEHLSPDQVLDLQRAVGNAAVARMLARQHDSGTPPQGFPSPVQRRSGVHSVLRSPGRPLEESVRAEMEAKLGADFSDVRVHTDTAARDSAKEIGARAYTSGSHVIIGEGGKDAQTLTHELVHVIQQRQGPVAGTDNGSGLSVSDPSDRFEREAEQIAARVTSAPAPHRAAGEAAPVMRRPGPVAAGRGGAHDPVQRTVAWYRQHDNTLNRFATALSNLTEAAAQDITNNADTIPGHPGSPRIFQWQEQYLAYQNSNKDDKNFKLLYARFGYAVEALVESWVRRGDIASSLPGGYTVRFQVASAHTRPDIVVLDDQETQVGWFDITSDASRGHIKDKHGTQWSTRPYVAEALYPKLVPSMLSASSAGPSDAPRRRRLAREARAAEKARIDTLGQVAKEIYNDIPDTIINNKVHRQRYFEEQMAQRAGIGDKIAPRTGRSLVFLLQKENIQKPLQRTGGGNVSKERISWMNAFGYLNITGTDPHDAEKYLDLLIGGQREPDPVSDLTLAFGHLDASLFD